MAQENDSWAFGDWWELLNAELSGFGEGEALYRDARYYHTANYSPATAANLLLQERAEALAYRAEVIAGRGG